MGRRDGETAEQIPLFLDGFLMADTQSLGLPVSGFSSLKDLSVECDKEKKMACLTITSNFSRESLFLSKHMFCQI